MEISSPTGNQWNQLMAATGSCHHLNSFSAFFDDDEDNADAHLFQSQARPVDHPTPIKNRPYPLIGTGAGSNKYSYPHVKMFLLILSAILFNTNSGNDEDNDAHLEHSFSVSG